MLAKFKEAKKLEPQNVVYASTTKGGMKVLYDGHHFKYVYKRYECGVFQCCYNENNEQCSARIIVNHNLVYPLDGEHNHFNQAMDKSVTSVLIEAGESEDNMVNETPRLNSISQNVTSDSNEFVVMEVRESVSDMEIVPEVITINDNDDRLSPNENELEEQIAPRNEDIVKKDCDVLREKIKKRLQMALMKKKK